MIAAWVAFFDGLLAIVLALAGIICAHYELTRPFTGFELLLLGFFIAALGLVIAIVALLMTFLMPTRHAGRTRAVLGAILTLIVILPIVRIIAATRQYPPINDITTDTKEPPEFVHAQELPQNTSRNMKYDPATYATAQQNAPAYKDLAPLKVHDRPDDVYKKAEIIAGEIPDWQITYRDAKTRSIEGVATSKLFRFQDDFVIQVRPAQGHGSLVEMRSKSRDGKGDLGVNYNRIEMFFQALQGSPRGVVAPS
jgi:uncharacterized protein (DUF1499 family)